MATLETTLTGALRCAAEVYDHDAAVAAAWSPRMRAQFEAQAKEARSVADAIEQYGLEAVMAGAQS